MCVLEKRREARWNGGGDYKRRSKIVYLVGARTGEWYIGKGKGKRLRESKWIMIGSIKSAQPTKYSPVSPDHFTAYTLVTFLPSTRDPTAAIKSRQARPLADNRAETTREGDEVSVHH